MASRSERIFAAARQAKHMRDTGQRTRGEHHHASWLMLAAKENGVSFASTKRALAVLDYGKESDVADIITGRVSLTARCNELRPKLKRPRKEPKQLGGPRGRPPLQVVRPAHWGGLKEMTRAEVDPEFTGTPTEFLDKYGHVQVMTAEQYATSRFTDWAMFVRSLAKEARAMPELKPVDHNWLRKPRERDIAKLTEALDCLRPKLAEAEALLEIAVAAMRKNSVQSPPDRLEDQPR